MIKFVVVRHFLSEVGLQPGEGTAYMPALYPKLLSTAVGSSRNVRTNSHSGHIKRLLECTRKHGKLMSAVVPAI